MSYSPNPYGYQPPHFQPQPPRPPRTFWQRNALWICLVGGFLIIASIAIYFVYRVTQSISEGVDNAFTKAQEMVDSLNSPTFYDENSYYPLLDTLIQGKVDSGAVLQNSIADFHDETDALILKLSNWKKEFRDSLGDNKSVFNLSTKESVAFFITSGRAQQFKLELKAYREKAALQFPPLVAADLRASLPIDEMQASNYRSSSHVRQQDWEHQNFGLPPSATMGRIGILIQSIRDFEDNVLRQYSDKAYALRDTI